MTGFEIKDLDNFVITNDVKSINIMSKKEIVKNECIKCGKCLNVCPVHINPLSNKNIDKCLKCGLCSYVCPCGINLKEV